jgi:hypothetical protein
MSTQVSLLQAAGFLLARLAPNRARTAGTARAAGKQTSPENSLRCNQTAQVVTEASVITVVCTLDPHEGGQHYDDAFCLGWTKVHD